MYLNVVGVGLAPTRTNIFLRAIVMDIINHYISRIDLFILVLVRMSGIFVVAPIFAAKNFPTYMKIGFAGITSLLIVSTIPNAAASFYNNSLLMYSVVVFKEFIVGLLIGFIAYMIFNAIYMAGEIIDMQMGFGVVNIMDPISNVQVPLTGNFYYILSLLIFLMADGHHLLISALFKSYETLPIGKAQFSTELLTTMIRLISDIFVIGFKIAAPIVLAMLITDIGLGILTKTMPQLNVFVVGMPLKIFIGLLIMMLTIPAFISIMDVLKQGVYSETFKVIGDMVPK